jgi:hypothetical protein
MEEPPCGWEEEQSLEIARNNRLETKRKAPGEGKNRPLAA